MKKHDLAILFLLIVVISFSFLSTSNNYVIGQTGSSSSSGDVASSSSSSGDTVSSSSSSSSGDIAASTSSSSGEVVSSSSTSSTSSSSGTTGLALNPNFTGLWKSKIEKPKGPPLSMGTSSSSSSSSSSGEVASSSSSGGRGLCAHDVCFGLPPTCLAPSVYVDCSDPLCNFGPCTGSGSSTSFSSSGSATRTTLFHIDENVRGSSIITFKLCVKDGKLEGTVQQGGVLIQGIITTQTVISSDEIEFTAESRDGKTAMIHLKLTSEREFIGRFADGHEFKGRKLNTLRGECQGPKGTMGGQGMSGLGEPTTSGGPLMGGPSMGSPSMSGPDMGTPGELGKPTTSGGPSMSGPSGPSMGTMFGGEDQGDNFTSSGGPGMGAPPSMGTLPPGMGGPPSMFGGEDVGE